MAKLTIQDKLIEILTDLGSKHVTDTRVTKSLVYTHPDEQGKFYFLGKNGAMRKGTKVGDSVSCPTTVKRLLRSWDQKHQGGS